MEWKTKIAEAPAKWILSEFHGIPTFQLESSGFRQNSWGRVKTLPHLGSHMLRWGIWCLSLSYNKVFVAQLVRALLTLLWLRVQFTDIVNFIFLLKYSKDTLNIRIVVIYMDHSMESIWTIPWNPYGLVPWNPCEIVKDSIWN